MGINFGNNVTQTRATKVIQFIRNEYSSISNFSTNSNTYQRMLSFNVTPLLSSSQFHVTLELHGYNSNGGHDNNFRIGFQINGGSASYIGGNSNNASGNGPNNLHGNVRGDHRVNSWCETFNETKTGSWSAGDTVTLFVDTIGEGTYYANQGNSTGQTRFGRGTCKMIVREIGS